MNFLDIQVAPPREWSTFEELTRALYAAVYDNPLAAKNGRSGQAQHGVDVYLEWPEGSGKWIGIQCKGKTRNYGAKATIQEFDAELAKAEKFKPSLSRWIFVTTSPDDAPLMEHARVTSTARTEAGNFPVDFLGWDSVHTLLAEHEAVARRFYPEHFSSGDDVARLASASAASLAAIEDSLAHGDASLSLVRPAAWSETLTALTSSRIVRLTGEGGAGKSGILKRVAYCFEGACLALKDNRVAAPSLLQHLAQHGIEGDPIDLLDRIAGQGPALCAIDGADRMLMSDRRGVVIDLFRALAACKTRDRWRIVTTARIHRERDLVSDALKEAGLRHDDAVVHVGAIQDQDIQILARAFPNFASVLTRGDLGEQNRSLFLLRELLRRKTPPKKVMTELDMADAWFISEVAEPKLAARRSRALAQIGNALVDMPWHMPGRADIDAEGLQALLDEGAVLQVPNQDALRLTYDVHEDWLLARHLNTRRDRLVDILKAAGEPLWWLRAVRLSAQLLLEQGDVPGWCKLLGQVDGAEAMDPIWSRAVISAPLHSEQSAQILDALEPMLLEQDALLLGRLLDTLIVAETVIDDRVLAFFADKDEAALYSIASHFRKPELRSWAAFLRWSLRRWAGWPPLLIPRLSEVAIIFVRATSHITNELSKSIVHVTHDWLVEIEDARHARWADRREPFGHKLERHKDWEKVEGRLRDALVEGVRSAPDIMRSYLARILEKSGMREPREKLIAGPGVVPTLLPQEWASMCLRQFIPTRRRRRRDDPFRTGLFDWHEMNDAGLRSDPGMWPSSPVRAGFDQLFAADEAAGLRFFHKLEMHSSIFWRWYNKCVERRKPVPVRIDLGHRIVTLWGDNPVYRWSRGILGGSVLGSAYLALDDWLSRQAAQGRPVSELIDLVLQNNGLIATAAPLIAIIGEQLNTEGVIGNAGAFLAVPRLWSFDIHRHIDDQGGAHRIGFFSSDNMYYQANERNHERHAKRGPLHHALLLPFRVLAPTEAQEKFDAVREAWTERDLADFVHELDDHNLGEERRQQVERFRSDSDPEQIVVESAEQGIKLTIAPPKQDLTDIDSMNSANRLMNEAAGLANWVRSTREQKAPAPSFEIEQAIEKAKELAVGLDIEGNMHIGVARSIGGPAIVGTAAAAAHFLSFDQLEQQRAWIEDWLVSAASVGERPEIPEGSYLNDDHQVMAAWGLAALASRGAGSGTAIDSLVSTLAVHRLAPVAEATLAGLNWDTRPEFVRALHIAALDACVVDIGWWWRGESFRTKAQHSARSARAKAAARAMRGCPVRTPLLPPPPDTVQWRWTGNWRKPIEHRLMPSKRVLDSGKALAVIRQINWSRLTDQGKYRGQISAWMLGVTEWTRSWSEESKRHDRQLPYEWVHGLAKAMGRFAFAHGGGKEWRSLIEFGRQGRSEDFLGDYLDGVAGALVESGEAPDQYFWNAWQPAAEWLMENAVSRRRDEYNHLGQGARAAGLVGPYQTPIPPNWPHLELALPAIDKWVKATQHQPSAAFAALQIVERMDLDQRRRWFLPWLASWTERNGSDESYWTYNSLGNKVAALLGPLASSDDETRRQGRVVLAILADAGATAARELITRFAGGRHR